MDNHILVNNHVETHFDFDLTVEGLKDDDIHVRFVISGDPFDMSFECKNESGTKWSVTLPKMPYLKPTTYNFTVEAIVDGYFFKAHSGTVTVNKSPEVYVKKEDAEMKVESKKTPEIQLTPTITPAKREVPEIKSEVAETPIVVETKSETLKPSQLPDQSQIDAIINRIKNTPLVEEENKTPLVKEVVAESTTDAEKTKRAKALKDAKVLKLIKESKEEKETGIPPVEEEKKTPLVKEAVAESTTNDEKTKRAKSLKDAKVLKLIKESKKEKETARQVKADKRKRLNEKARAKRKADKEALEQRQADEAAAKILEESSTKNEVADREAKVRAIFESAKTSPEPEESTTQVFKRRNVVVK